MRAQFIYENIIDDYEYSFELKTDNDIKKQLSNLIPVIIDTDKKTFYDIRKFILHVIKHPTTNIEVKDNNTLELKFHDSTPHMFSEDLKFILRKYVSNIENVKNIDNNTIEIKFKKSISESLNEKFTEDSDPVHSMGIGMPHLLKNIVEKLFDIDIKGDYMVDSYVNKGNLNHIRIYKSTFCIDFYSNPYKEMNGKKFSKKDFCINLLKEAGIFNCFEKNIEVNGLNVFFKIKKEYVDYFPNGWYDEMAYYHKNKYKWGISSHLRRLDY